MRSASEFGSPKQYDRVARQCIRCAVELLSQGRSLELTRTELMLSLRWSSGTDADWPPLPDSTPRPVKDWSCKARGHSDVRT